MTDEMWEEIRWHLPAAARTGRPRWDDRAVLESILWLLRTGARWRDLPVDGPSPATCWRRLRDWEERGVWEAIWRAFVERLDRQSAVDWSQVFADGSFAPAKKGAPASARPNAARARSGWWWSTAKVFLWHANLPRPLPPRGSGLNPVFRLYKV